MKWNKRKFSKKLVVDNQILIKDRQHNIDSEIRIDTENSIQPITRVPNGDNVVFAINLTDDNDNYGFEWFKSNSNNKNQFEVIKNETKPTLKLTKINTFLANQNLFKCVVTNLKNNKSKEIITRLEVINPKIEIASPTYSNTILNLNKPAVLNLEANIANKQLNPKWKIQYQWVYWKNNTWNKFKSSNNITGAKTSSLKFKKLDYSLVGLKIGCVLNVDNIMNDEVNIPHINTITHLSIDEPEIDNLKIWSNEVSKSGHVKMDSTPILNVQTHFKNYLKLPNNYSLQYRWLVFKNNNWMVACKDQIFVLEKQSHWHTETKIKVNVSVLNHENKKVNTFTSDILNIKVNPNVDIKKEWDSLTLLKHQTFNLKCNVKIKHLRRNAINYQWFFNNQPIESNNANFLGQNSNQLTIINPIINNSGDYKLVVDVNGISYDFPNNTTKVTVMDNNPIITNLEYPQELNIYHSKKSFKIKIDNLPQVNYELPNGIYKINWFIKKGNESEYQIIQSKNGIIGLKSPTLKFRKFPPNSSEIDLIFKVRYVNKQNPNIVYSEYVSKPINIKLKQN